MKTNQKLVTTLALSLTFSIAGCGGGGGSGISTTLPTQPLPTQPGSASQLNTGVGQVLGGSLLGRAATGRGAANAPVRGSVTQSSNSDNGGISTDRVELEAEILPGVEGGDGSLEISLTRTNEGGTTRTIAKNEEGVVELYGYDNTLGGLNTGAPDLGGGFYKRFDDEGHLFVNVAFKGSDAINTDYLARGIWVYVPDSGADDQFESIAFADGSDEFAQNSIAVLAGTATYAGAASGVYADASGTDTSFFEAIANLTADFGNTSDRGTISGSISGFEGGPLGNATLTLGEASIGDFEGGFFTGETSLTLGEDAYAGQWGGQFHGNPDSSATGADAQPVIAAGTFGATTTGGESILGTFDAEKQ